MNRGHCCCYLYCERQCRCSVNAVSDWVHIVARLEKALSSLTTGVVLLDLKTYEQS